MQEAEQPRPGLFDVHHGAVEQKRPNLGERQRLLVCSLAAERAVDMILDVIR